MSEFDPRPQRAEELHGEIKDYRQPLVTSLGLVLGFLLNYIAQWADKSRGMGMFEDATDCVIFATILGAVSVLVLVLYRMLNPRLPADPLAYYRTSLRLYVVGLVLAFSGFLIACLV